MPLALGAQGTQYLEPNEWLVSGSYRYLNSFRDFHGSEEIPDPAPPEIYANTHLHTFDLTATYALTRRFSLTLEVPFQYGARETYYEHDGVSLHTMEAGGLGDVRLLGNLWLLAPEKHTAGNVSLGLGVKAPTGDHKATDYSYRSTGRVRRPVDPAIQPGDGGWGVIFVLQAFGKLSENSAAYFHGSYLSNPREMNGTQTPFGDDPALTGGDIGYTIDSVPDQYLARTGVAYTVWPEQGLALSLGARIDGVPVRDLIGDSQGYRLPGYAVSIEPGLTVSKGRNFFSLTAPVAVERHASKSLADERTGSPVGGFAAFADFVIIASYSRRF